MKGTKLFWGLFFILLGVVFILKNLGMLHFEFRWSEIFRLWPLILIFMGISALLGTSKYKVPWVAPLMLVIVILIFTRFEFGHHYDNPNWRDNEERPRHHDKANSQNFSEPWVEGMKQATFNFTGGAAEFMIIQSTDNLIDANTVTRFGDYSMERVSDDSSMVINLRMTDKKITWKKGDWVNKVYIRLNQAPVWNMNFELGAGSGEFDLSPYKINKLTVESGATALDIKVKDNLPKTIIDIETGASSVTVRVPKTANCLLDLDAVLSSKDVEGFIKKDDGSYQSENFSSIGNLIDIRVSAGVSEINVVRY